LTSEDDQLSLRVLLLAPTTRDADITCRLIEGAGLSCHIAPNMSHLIADIAHGAGAVLLTDEVLNDPAADQFIHSLQHQPSWSDLPVVMLARGGAESPAAERLIREGRNLTLLERPAPMRSVQSAVHAAVRGRARQYELRHTIDETRRAERRAKDLQQQLELAVAASELGAFHCAIPLDTVVFDDRCKAHFWLPPAAQFDLSTILSIIHPEDRDRIRRAVDDSVARNAPCDVEFRTVSPVGEVRWIRATGRTYLGEAGQPQWFDGTTQDVTRRKQIEEEREMLLDSERAARTEAERANRVKDEFLATVSHELRTPLNAILGWTQLLAHSRGDWATVDEAAGIIDRNARLQAELIEDLLDVSRVISGKLRLNMQPVDISTIVSAAVASVQPAADARRIRIQKRFEADIPALHGDPGRLQQVVWNLLSNALKFTPVGGEVLVSVNRSDGHIEIRVTDSGPGLEPQFIPHVFEQFRQADASITRKHGGLGLGLAIVKHLVERHGGTVEAENVSRPDGTVSGAIFLVRLPVDPPQKGGDALSDPSLSRQLPGAIDLAGLRILVVDDDPDARRLLKRLLAECKADVITASSGREALQLLATSNPNVLVSDIGMPEMDGYEFISQVRKAPVPGSRIPAAAVTAFTRDEDRRRALAAGYQTHIPKPIEPSRLLAVVADLAGRRNSRQ